MAKSPNRQCPNASMNPSSDGSVSFYGQCHRVAAAEAKRREASPGVAARHLVEECHQDAGARSSNGMPQRYGAAIHVGFGGIEAQLFNHREGLNRKSFLQLNHVHRL